MKTKLNVLSLFSGIGGIDLGLENTGGFQTTAFCEIDVPCQKILEKHWPQVEIYSDVSKLKSSKGSYDVIVGGFPCQDISFAGNRAGISKGARSGLWKQYFRLIKEVQPKYVLIENVEYLRKNGLGVVLNDLASIGYDAEWSNITARSVGYPHQRQRLFIVAYPSSQRLHERIGQERHIQTDQERASAEIYANGQQCQPESLQVRPILSRGLFECLAASHPSEFSAVSTVRRVVDGIPEGLHEKLRKQRIKQLGNAVVPRIAEILGYMILEHHNLKSTT